MKTMKKGLGMNKMLGGLKRRTTGMFTPPSPPAGRGALAAGGCRTS